MQRIFRSVGAAVCALLFGQVPLAVCFVVPPQHEASGKPASTGWCIVCDGPAGPDATTEYFKGRRVSVCSEACCSSWRENQDLYFAKLQARGALFDEETMSDRSLMSGWMWFGCYVLVGLVCAAGAAYGALARGARPLPWMLAGLAFNVVALLLLFTRPRGDLSRLPEGVPAGLRKIPATWSPAACAKCGRENHPSARQCTACGAPLQPRVEGETARVLRGAKA